MPTIDSATRQRQTSENHQGTVIALIGENRTYAIGDTAYRFSRNERHLTLPNAAKGIPVTLIDGKWVVSELARAVIKNWTDVITVID